ncbi:MAG: hypothetical protein WBV78_18820 [Roseobacter sp.]
MRPNGAVLIGHTKGMTQEVDKKAIRQFAYRERSIRAQTYARVLMPVAVFAVGATVWMDPDLRPQVTAGIEEIRPIVATYLVDTPFEDLLGPVPVAAPTETDGTGVDGDQVAASFDLPEDAVPVNRP